MDSQKPFEEAKVIDEILKRTATNEDGTLDKLRFILILAGMMTETLIEYEEPDAVMEQSFHRISQLLHATPVPDTLAKHEIPSSVQIDIETEVGREIARESAERMPKDLDDVHEVIIAIAFNEFTTFETDGLPVPECLRIMIEAVIQSLLFEMATQEFADVIIEDFITDGWPISDVLLTLGGVAGHYLSQKTDTGQEDADSIETKKDQYIAHVMAAEALRHGLNGGVNWNGLDGANDMDTTSLHEDIQKCVSIFNEFFEVVDLTAPSSKAVAVSKTAGRMAALVSGEEMSLIQPSLAKVLLKTGFMGALKPKDEGASL